MRKFGLDYILSVITVIMSSVAACAIMLIMGVILADISLRFLLNSPLAGTPEIVAMLLATIVFLQFPSAVRIGRSIHATIFLDMIGKKSAAARSLVHASWHLLGSVVFAVLFYFLVLKAGREIRSADFYGVPGRFMFPTWPLVTLITFSSLIVSLQYLFVAVKAIFAVFDKSKSIENAPHEVEIR